MFSGHEQLVRVLFEQVADQLRLKGNRERALADQLVGYGQPLSPLVFVLVAGAWLGWIGSVAAAAAKARRPRASRPGAAAGHVPDAEIHLPSLPGTPYAGRCGRSRSELTPKPLARTGRIMTGLLNRPARYAQVLYLTGPATRTVVPESAEAIPTGQQVRIVIRDLPSSAFTREAGCTTNALG